MIVMRVKFLIIFFARFFFLFIYILLVNKIRPNNFTVLYIINIKNKIV